jgi:hypothetical protein
MAQRIKQLQKLLKELYSIIGGKSTVLFVVVVGLCILIDRLWQLYKAYKWYKDNDWSNQGGQTMLMTSVDHQRSQSTALNDAENQSLENDNQAQKTMSSSVCATSKAIETNDRPKRNSKKTFVNYNVKDMIKTVFNNDY